MPFSELVKNFEKIRSYVREFYVYGFRIREEFDKKSGRTYDNERRRDERAEYGLIERALEREEDHDHKKDDTEKNELHSFTPIKGRI